MTLFFTKTSTANQWTVSGGVDAGQTGGTPGNLNIIGSTTLVFSSAGGVLSGTPLNVSSLTGLVLLIGSLAAGFALRYLVHLLTIVPVFWWQRGQGLQMMYWHMARFIERPDRIYTGIVRVVLTTVLPFALMASVPARFYLEPFDARLCLHVTLVLLAFVAATALAWRAGLRAYSSASS